MNWQSLSSEGDFEQILQSSQSRTQAIFKHSTRCGISAMAKYRVEGDWGKKNPDTPIYLLDLIQHRDLSDLIAQRLEVHHESPQLILVRNGKAIFNSSHISISSSSAAKHIQK